MTESITFDPAAAHVHFSVECFNRAWTYLDRPSRTPDEDEALIALCQASMWHWTQRDDCTTENLSIGYWQLARAHAVVGRTEGALHYADRCLAVSATLSPFYVGYGHEAMARAFRLAGNREGHARHLALALSELAKVIDPEERDLLERDLKELASFDASTRPES